MRIVAFVAAVLASACTIESTTTTAKPAAAAIPAECQTFAAGTWRIAYSGLKITKPGKGCTAFKQAETGAGVLSADGKTWDTPNSDGTTQHVPAAVYPSGTTCQLVNEITSTRADVPGVSIRMHEELTTTSATDAAGEFSIVVTGGGLDCEAVYTATASR